MAEPQENTSKPKCVGCGAELPANAPSGLCPKCLLKLAMETQPGTGPEGTVKISGIGAASRGLPQPGEQLGHYTIIRALGAGGMGAVYEAQDAESGRRVALKVLSHRLDSPEARQRFFREGRLAASINHPNSVYIFGTEEIGGTPVISMELVAGGTLQDRVRARGPLPIGQAVDSVLQLVEGLDAAQRVGILHRDVKPSNCYVGEDGTVKIGDFGLSISSSVRTEPAITTTGTFLGTPAFCSPEQLRGEELNTRSDMYAVGATLFYMLTGRTPFEAKHMVQLLATVLEQRAPSPRQFRPEIPQGLAKVVLRCLEKQPAERFKNYGDLTKALAPYCSAGPTPATLGLRFVAGVIDMVVLGGCATAINLSVSGSVSAFMDQAMQLSTTFLLCTAGWFCLATLYYGVFEGVWGAAVGKSICRLRVAGTDRNPPGFVRAWVRALTFVVLPMVPYWLAFGANHKGYPGLSAFRQMLMGLAMYGVMALLFATARRRNGFAAVQDLLTGTRVISRAAFAARRAPALMETPPPTVASAITIGPYHVLQALSEAGETKWFLGYDLKLLRKVWLRVVPADTPPVPIPLRNLGRVGRLRWLTGRRSPGENWDAFEALSGQPFLALVGSPQPWRKVRYWLHDLAVELSAAEKDGTVPTLGLDRIWITVEGRAKLLDFPVPATGAGPQPPVVPASVPRSPPIGAAAANPSANSFLSSVAAVALTGDPNNQAQSAGQVAVPLPLHARAFLTTLSQAAGAEAIAAGLTPLLNKVATVSRLRRAALLCGCVVFPLLTGGAGFFTFDSLHEMNRKYPGMLDLSSLLQGRNTSRFWGKNNPLLPTDRQYAIYIAHHYRGLITNGTAWSGYMALSTIQGENRKFAEQSVAEHPNPTPDEIKEADETVGKYVPKESFYDQRPSAALPVMALAMALVVFVGFPAVLAALAFRGGLVLLVSGVAFVRRDGRRSSRLRLLWRSLVTWSPSLPVFFFSFYAMAMHLAWQPWLALALLGLLAALSLALPTRGLQDRLAGTWPVPR
jgi:hypothetical protein